VLSGSSFFLRCASDHLEPTKIRHEYESISTRMLLVARMLLMRLMRYLKTALVNDTRACKPAASPSYKA